MRPSEDTASMPARPLLRIAGLTKDFPGLRALDDVALDVLPGEVVAVAGHNGSGKSTLVKILAGIYSKDAGTIELAEDENGQAGIHIIHQDLGLAMQLSAIENLGLTQHRLPVETLAPIHTGREHQHARALLRRFGAPFDLDVPIARLAPAQRSIIAIARALDGWTDARNVLILDEPTEALHATEVRILFDAVRRLAAEGAGVIFISHRLDEVLDLADRIVVLRDGQKVADEPTQGIDHDRLVALITGVPAGTAVHGRSARDFGETLLDVEGLTGANIEDVDLRIRAGEVVGVAGTLGSGREALPAMIFGAIPATARRYELAGRPFVRRSPDASIRRGMAFIPGDRGKFGSIRAFTARENMTLPELRSMTGSLGVIGTRRERRHATDLIRAYDVKPPRTEQIFAQFSGGNQQKIVFAKWLRNLPTVLLLEEPTQGVDIGAKQAIYAAIDAAAAQASAVLVCSSDAKELVRLCDRVLVLRNGRVSADLAGEDLTEARLVIEGYGLTRGDDAATSTEGAA